MVQSMATKRIGVGCAIVNRIIYAVGGFDGHNRLSSVEKYVPETGEWSFVKSMSTPRSGAGRNSSCQSINIFYRVISCSHQ